jgi:hypothetical protein
MIEHVPQGDRLYYVALVDGGSERKSTNFQLEVLARSRVNRS